MIPEEEHYAHVPHVTMFFDGGPMDGERRSQPVSEYTGEVRVPVPITSSVDLAIVDGSSGVVPPKIVGYRSVEPMAATPCGCGVVWMEYRGET